MGKPVFFSESVLPFPAQFFPKSYPLKSPKNPSPDKWSASFGEIFSTVNKSNSLKIFLPPLKLSLSGIAPDLPAYDMLFPSERAHACVASKTGSVASAKKSDSEIEKYAK